MQTLKKYQSQKKHNIETHNSDILYSSDKTKVVTCITVNMIQRTITAGCGFCRLHYCDSDRSGAKIDSYVTPII